jgi:hypothetical protein
MQGNGAAAGALIAERGNADNEAKAADCRELQELPATDVLNAGVNSALPRIFWLLYRC